MNTFQRLIYTMFFIFCCNAEASNETKNFSPTPTTSATLTLSEDRVTYNIFSQELKNHGSVIIETEKKAHIEISDFNFDGKKDFSVWYTDDGMGTYTIHRVFLYSPKTLEFLEHFPQCGDEFINLKIDTAKKLIKSTYYKDNTPETCKTKLPKY